MENLGASLGYLLVVDTWVSSLLNAECDNFLVRQFQLPQLAEIFNVGGHCRIFLESRSGASRSMHFPKLGDRSLAGLF